jgi:acetyl-CoA carboxylase biotin carboxylase subunit
MERMGSKLDARKIAKLADVPVVPGSGPVTTLEEAKAAAEVIGYPVLMKASAGGGGIGMTAVKNEKKLERALSDVQRKGETFFGDGTVYLEKLIEKPAHVEIQILCDNQGHCVILGDRDCSVQRRNQKIIEETPSTHIDESTRQAMYDAARRLVQESAYVNAGTVEMIVEGGSQSEGNFYFLEVNARLQVEHPVTEMVTGLLESGFFRTCN